MKFEVRDGCFAYSRSAPLTLDGISFEANGGELIAVLGPNGAGKTTLLRCIMGFLPWRSGGSYIDGRDIRAMKPAELWRSIAYVPQAKGAATAYTAAEMVLLGRSGRFGMFSQPSRGDREAALAALDRLGLSALADRSCAEMSGGELQMVLIARALASEPQLLILDEPESNLDFKNQLVILNTLSALAAEGIACIFNTHYPAHALQRAGRSLLLYKNGRHDFGATAEVITEKSIEAAFGVKAIIGEIKSDGGALIDVLPVSVSEKRSDYER